MRRLAASWLWLDGLQHVTLGVLSVLPQQLAAMQASLRVSSSCCSGPVLLPDWYPGRGPLLRLLAACHAASVAGLSKVQQRAATQRLSSDRRVRPKKIYSWNQAPHYLVPTFAGLQSQSCFIKLACLATFALCAGWGAQVQL